MILLCNGDSWTQGDSPAQQFNWNAKPNLDWYNVIPDFGEPSNPCEDKILYKLSHKDGINEVKKIQIREEAALCLRDLPETIRAKIRAGLFRSLSA